jgi:hypothetical protein
MFANEFYEARGELSSGGEAGRGRGDGATGGRGDAETRRRGDTVTRGWVMAQVDYVADWQVGRADTVPASPRLPVTPSPCHPVSASPPHPVTSKTPPVSESLHQSLLPSTNARPL